MLCPKCGCEVIKANVGLGRHVILEQRDDIFYVRTYPDGNSSAHPLSEHAVVHDCEKSLKEPIIYSLEDLKKTTLLNMNDASKVLNISKRTIEDWIHRKGMPHFKIGSLIRFSYDDLMAWVNSCKVNK